MKNFNRGDLVTSKNKYSGGGNEINIYDEEKVITHEEARKIAQDMLPKQVGSKSSQNKVKKYFELDLYLKQQELKEERAKKVEEFISLCYVETTDTGHEVVFWRDENYEYAKQLLKMLKGEMK